MDLHSDYPYWLLKNGLLHEYPSLFQDTEAEIVVLGGGISGALIAWQLTQRGKQVLLLDGRHIGMGSTCASTSMLQYELDLPMHQLAKKTGEKEAVRAYKLCIEAVDQVEQLAAETVGHGHFERKPSLQYASSGRDFKELRKEFELRKKHGFDVELLDSKELLRTFQIKAPGGLMSPSNSGQLDVYRFTHALLQKAMANGLQVYDKTRVDDIVFEKNGVTLKTGYGQQIKARQLVVATGYEAAKYFSPKMIKLYSTYALVTEPYENDHFWHRNSLIWETANPYLYFRSTSDNRILVGGKDEPFYNPEKRDRLLKSKTSQLCRSFEKIFPHLAPLRVDFSWAGTFAGTPDSLPYIGTVKKYPHTWFSLGYGGNGILFSQVAAMLLGDVLCGHNNEDLRLFAFDRKNT